MFAERQQKRNAKLMVFAADAEQMRVRARSIAAAIWGSGDGGLSGPTGEVCSIRLQTTISIKPARSDDRRGGDRIQDAIIDRSRAAGPDHLAKRPRPLGEAIGGRRLPATPRRYPNPSMYIVPARLAFRLSVILPV